ncbi:Oxidoreductase, short chain dehydrogenase/reductase family protein [Acinetobacter baumannii]|nr:Oxidoreductase, short chain dehydrogenase/reductase family protein [Acinetobacter baumannii]
MLEESEHKDIAYDVYQLLNGSYPLRASGFFLAFFTILGLIPATTLFIPVLRKPQEMLTRKFWKDARRGGAGSGIGRSFAIELAKRGGSVVCADINLEAAEETVTLLEQQGAKAFAMHCDVGNPEHVTNLAETAEILLSHPVTLVINNAGVGLGGKFDELSLEDWKTCGVLFMVVMHLCQSSKN